MPYVQNMGSKEKDTPGNFSDENTKTISNSTQSKMSKRYTNFRVREESTGRSVQASKNNKQQHWALYDSKSLVEDLDNGAKMANREIQIEKNGKQKYRQVFLNTDSDGAIQASIFKNNNEKYLEGKKASRVASRKNKQIDRIAKRQNRKMDRM